MPFQPSVSTNALPMEGCLIHVTMEKYEILDSSQLGKCKKKQHVQNTFPYFTQDTRTPTEAHTPTYKHHR
jgi:hypothetical protein